MPSLSFFDSLKSARPSALVAFVALHLVLKGVFFSLPFYTVVARPVEVATAGLVSPVVLAGVIELALLVGVVMLWMGGLRPRDLGLRGLHLLNAALVALLVWGGVQAALSAVAASGYADAALNPAFALGPGRFGGEILEATLGSAFVEEVMYRGFLVPQLYLLSRRWTRSKAVRAALAVGLPQLYFGLNHIPAGLRMHLPAAEIAVYVVHVVLVGLLFTALYLRTGNLFVAVAAHALVNNPAPVFVAGPDPALLALVGVCGLLLAWPALHRLADEVFTLAEAPVAARGR